MRTMGKIETFAVTRTRDLFFRALVLWCNPLVTLCFTIRSLTIADFVRTSFLNLTLLPKKNVGSI